MKPFNLERAFTGYDVITRNGLYVTRIKYTSDNLICGSLNGDRHTWYRDGRYDKDKEHKYDLFMAD